MWFLLVSGELRPGLRDRGHETIPVMNSRPEILDNLPDGGGDDGDANSD